MTQPPHSDPSPSDSADSSSDSSPQRCRRSPLRQVALVAGATLVVVVVAGVAVGRHWVYTRLVPTVETSVGRLIQRPVKLGDVEGVTPFSVRFGETLLPPTPDDPDRARVEALRVRFNPLEVLLKRQLSFTVILVRPQAVIEQSPAGRWIDIQVDTPEPGPIKFRLDRVRLEQAQVALVPHLEMSADTSSDSEMPTHSSARSQPSALEGATLPPTWSQPQTWQPIADHAVAIAPINGTVQLRDDNRRFLFDVTGQPWIDPDLTSSPEGQLHLRGELDLGEASSSGFDLNALQAKLAIRTQNLAIAPLASLLPNLPANLTAGQLHSQLEVAIAANLEVDVVGTARLEDVNVQAAALPVGLSDGGGQVRFRGGTAQLEGVTAQVGGSQFEARGQIRYGDSLRQGYDLVVEGSSLDLATLLDDAAIAAPVELSGRVSTEVQITGPLRQPQIAGTLNQVRPIQVDRLQFDTVGARFQVRPHGFAPATLEISAIQATLTSGGIIAGNGQLELKPLGRLDFDLNASNLSADALARLYGAQPLPADVQLGLLSANLTLDGTLQSPQVLASWSLPQATYPAQGNVQLQGDRLQLQNTTVQVLGGVVQPEADLNLSNRQWQATATLAEVPLRPFVPQQSGEISGQVQASGNLADLSPAAIDAEGRLRLSSTPILGEPLTADVRWLGNGIELRQAVTPSVRASGFIATRLDGENAPSITQLNLNVETATLDIQQAIALLPTSLPANVSVSGQTRFAGQVTGTPSTPTLDGSLDLNNLVINDAAFEPSLAGRVQFTLGEGGRLRVSGQRDRIALTLDERYRPVAFQVRQGRAVAEGQARGDRLITQFTDFPIATLNLRPGAELGLGRAAGDLSGTLELDLADLDVTNLETLNAFGNIEIINPSVGHIEGDRFQGRLIYENGIVAINGGQLRVGDSTYAIVGRISPTDDTLFRGQLSATNGGIQDLLVALQYFELSDVLRFLSPPTYGTATDIEPVPITISDAPLLNQLQRYSEITELREQQLFEAQQSEIFPPLGELSGDFSGIIDVTVSRESGLSADFNITGEDWSWGEYEAPNRLIAEGNFTNNTLTLLPLRFESGDTLINFAGQIGQDEDSTGQVRIENVPAEVVVDFLRLPLDIQGNLNATATITESISNPQARGAFELTNGTLNQTPVQQARASFSYGDARLNLIGGMRITENDPIRVSGSIPFQLPQGTVAPASDEIRLEVQLVDEGLALLNVLSDQIAWEGGSANVSLQINGTLRQTPNGIDLRPLANGVAQLQGGRFSSRLLPEPLTDVSGTIRFNTDRINVENLRGQFSDGDVSAEGVVPLAEPLAIVESDADVSPLTVNLSGLAVNFKGLYNGGVEGQIQVGGTALAPQLSGEVLLSDGRVSLPDPAAIGETQAAAAPAFGAIFSPPELTNLQVTLGDRLLITRAPILNFVATGSLVVDGSLDDFRTLRPDGIIRLRSGQVNVFTTQFNLDQSHDNVAIFRPSQGADPILNVRLATSVLEQTRTIQPPASPYAQSEIIDTTASDLGGIQTVRIEAAVNGPASQIFDNLELTSSPSRSENEIIALIGGGFVNTLDGDDDTLAIANLAGNALFTSIQTLISNAIGFSDFRIFPTVITDDDREEGSGDDIASTLGLAAELGISVTDELSVSILQLLTVREPTQFSLRYRFDDQWLLRGSTNFSDDSRIVLEYEARF